MDSKNAPVEPKVWAATGGSGAGLAVALFVDYLLEQTLFHGTAVPEPVQGMVTLVVTIGLPLVATFAAGWLAPHMPRAADVSPAKPYP